MSKILIFIENWEMFWEGNLLLSALTAFVILLIIAKSASIIDYLRFKKVNHG